MGHLLNPSSISYSRRYLPSHLSYPTFPPSYHLRRCLPPGSSLVVYNPIQQQPRGVQPHPAAASWCTTPSSSSPWCTAPAVQLRVLSVLPCGRECASIPEDVSVTSPSQASSSSWCTAPAGRAGGRAEGLGGEGEREEKLRKIRSIPWLELLLLSQ